MAGFGELREPVSAEETGLLSPARLAVLQRVGLSATADEGMERFARMVARTLSVPVALVSLVEADRQVFPGMVGLPEPWATSRQTPLSHSLCQHMAVSGAPLILPDARRDELSRTSLALDDLGVVAYAGMPLSDGQGYVLGSLCAIDQRPRSWTSRELADLADLAAACSVELRLRIESRRAHEAEVDAEAAQLAAERSDERAQAYAAQAQLALARSELMLRAAEELADTVGLAEVRRRVRDLVSGDLKPAYVGLVLRDGEQLRWIPDPEGAFVTETRTPVFPLASRLPSARAARNGEIVVVSDRASMAAEYGPDAVAEYEVSGLQAAVCVPLPGRSHPLGTLILGWKTPYQIEITERAVLTAIAGYTARAIERALHLDDRITVAHQLQEAMLTDLPVVPGLELAALYRPDATIELVGGDWYDAYPLRPGRVRAAAGHNRRGHHRPRHARCRHHGADPQHAAPGRPGPGPRSGGRGDGGGTGL